MRLAQLVDIDNSRFISSTVATSVLPEFDSAASYAVGDKVKVSYKSDGTTPYRPIEIYQCATAASSPDYPPDNPTEWTLLGVTNRWAMYDQFANTQTEDTKSIEVEVDASDQNMVGLFRLQAKIVTLSLIENKELMSSPDLTADDFIAQAGWSFDTSSSPTLYLCDGSQTSQSKLYQTPIIKNAIWYQVEFTVSSYTAGSIAGFVGGTQGTFVTGTGTFTQVIASDGTDEAGVVADASFDGVIDVVSVKKVPNHEVRDLGFYDVDVTAGWYYYFYYDMVYREDITATFTDYTNSILRVTFDWKAGETAKVGKLALGKIYSIGMTQYDATVGITDYSKKTTDSLGRTYLKQGNFAKRADVDAWLYNEQLDAIRRRLQGVRGQAIMIDANNYQKSNYGSLLLYGFLRDWDITIPGPTISKLTIDIEGLI